jgi:hypothetical protein
LQLFPLLKKQERKPGGPVWNFGHCVFRPEADQPLAEVLNIWNLEFIDIYSQNKEINIESYFLSQYD